MHTLQPKHSKLNEKETEEFLSKLNISKAQLPKILSTDTALPEDCIVGDIIKIERSKKLEIPNSSASIQSVERKEGDKVHIYFRVVV
ncbi:hypothetical protein ES703_83476 [subsurface metagenome]